MYLVDALGLPVDVVVCDLPFVDDNVLHAADETGRVSGQHRLVLVDPAQVGVLEDGVFLVHRADGVGGLDPVVAEQEVRRVDGDVSLLPVGVVQLVSNHDALKLVNQVRVQNQLPANKKGE